MNSCLICSLNQSKKFLVFEGKFWQVDKPMNINLPGLFFIKTKRHVEQLEDLTSEESGEIGNLIKKFAKESKKLPGVKRVLALSLGLSEPHIHFWLIPVTNENQTEIIKIQEAVRNFAKIFKF